MRLLVMSDSHGKTAAIDRIISGEPEAKHIFFLGDVVSDIEYPELEYSDRIFHIVAGNCDGYSFSNTYEVVGVAGKKILFTHGHTLFLEYGGTEPLWRLASENGCDIALYGHTHIPDITYLDGIYIVNPGSVGRSREGAESYAVIDIDSYGILPQIKRI